MTLTPTSADEGVIYTCHVDVPGGESYHVMELPVRFCKFPDPDLAQRQTAVTASISFRHLLLFTPRKARTSYDIS